MVIIMGRETMHSSIALLQERFRELQRVKEMREERELLKMMLNTDHQPPNKQYLMSSNSINHPASMMMTCYYEPTTRLFFHPELIAIPSCRLPSPSPSPPPPPALVSLSLWPTSSPQLQDDNKKKTSAEVKQCLHGSSWEDWESNSADSDGVDTTLHL
ncbi:hypothetical protein PIB30_020270 [Stylosanthes scabra]|uniref:Uncharacterized protein n=1 Tax=Stylosanthes scabra TaxID=79078 RepID=A0ABU6U7W2_9FABA|nr:hypothetical protein [Stylosanthes scabra]